MSAEQLEFMQKTQSIVPRVHVFGRRRNAAELLVSRTVSMDNVSQENTLVDAAEHGIHHACVSKGLYIHHSLPSVLRSKAGWGAFFSTWYHHPRLNPSALRKIPINSSPSAHRIA